MNDRMFWILPKLSCRLIAADDGFDTETATEAEHREMFEKYKGVRNGDLTRYRAIERKAGTRKPKQVIYCARLYGYYAGDDGCYAVPEVIEIVKTIFRMCKENHRLQMKKMGGHKTPNFNIACMENSQVIFIFADLPPKIYNSNNWII